MYGMVMQFIISIGPGPIDMKYFGSVGFINNFFKIAFVYLFVYFSNL